MLVRPMLRSFSVRTGLFGRSASSRERAACRPCASARASNRPRSRSRPRISTEPDRRGGPGHLERALLFSRLPFLLLALVAVLGCSDAQDAEGGGRTRGRGESGLGDGAAMPRLISLNPSLTAIVFRLGGEEALVAVDDYSAQLFPKRTAELPRVGGLFDPNLESIVALNPDKVLLVAGVDQQIHGERIAKAGVAIEVFENERFAEVIENIDRLGEMIGRGKAAERRIATIRQTRAAVEQVTSKWPSPATVAVLDRSPFYVVGGETFLDEMLESVGARNLGRKLGLGYPRGSIEWLIAAAPVLLLDMTPDEDNGMAFWKRWPSLPAVVGGRVLTLEASRISLPGPDMDRALIELAASVHGAEIESEIEAALDAEKRP